MSAVDIEQIVRDICTPDIVELRYEDNAYLQFTRTLEDIGVSARHEEAAIIWLDHSLRGHPKCDAQMPLMAATLRSNLHRLHHYHLRHEIASPVTARVRRHLETIIERHGFFLPQKRALTIEELLALVRVLDLRDPYDLRARAMILFGYDAAQRPREWLRTSREQIRFCEKRGIMATFTFAKNNQSGKPRHVAIPFAKREELCPVIAMREWIDRMNISSGPIFRPIQRSSTGSIHPNQARGIFKRCALRAGIDTTNLSLISLRVGRLTESAERGHTFDTMRRRSLHRTDSNLRAYIRDSELEMDDYDAVLQP